MSTSYQSCMASKMGDGRLKNISREERTLEFCTIAKECSKGLSHEAAKQFCINNPAAPKNPGTGRGRRGIDSSGIAACLLPMLTSGQSVSVKELAAWISECSGKSGGIKIKKPESKKHFIKVCAMQAIVEQGLKGTFAESVRLQKQCEQKWKEKEAANENQRQE